MAPSGIFTQSLVLLVNLQPRITDVGAEASIDQSGKEEKSILGA